MCFFFHLRYVTKHNAIFFFSMETTTDSRSAWDIVEKPEPAFDKPGSYVCCDKRLHLFKFSQLPLVGLSPTFSDDPKVHDLLINDSSSRSQTISSFFFRFEKKNRSFAFIQFISNEFNTFNVVLLEENIDPSKNFTLHKIIMKKLRKLNQNI